MSAVFTAWLRALGAEMNYAAARMEYAAKLRECERAEKNRPPVERKPARKAWLFLVKS